MPGVTSCVRIPMYAYRTRPVRTSWSSERRAMSIGIANPTPSAVPGSALDLRVDADHAPARVEERPAGVAAVDRGIGLDRVRDAEAGVSESIERPIAETTPTESEVCLPNGLPIAATGSPTTTRAESPSGNGRDRDGPPARPG